MNKLKKILIIDDDEISTYITEKIVYKCTVAEHSQTFHHSGNALLSLKNAFSKQTELPDLILLDINMPILDGWDFINELQKAPHYKPIPIVVLSSSDYSDDQNKSKTFPEIKGYIIKPLTLEELNKMMQQIFNTETDGV